MPTVLITGGHAGIGLQCAIRLATHHRSDLILAGRSVERMEPAAQQLRAYGVKVSTVVLDTSSLASVRSAAAAIGQLIESEAIGGLDAIVCNAGASFAGPVGYSVDGYERTFTTNYLGHFLLTELLFDQLRDTGRIVMVASGTHDPDTMDGRMVGPAVEPDAVALANVGRNGSKPLSGGKLYATSKLCMILMAYEMDRRLRRAGSSIASIAFDPGAIPETGLTRTMPGPIQSLTRSAPVKWFLTRIGITAGSLEFSGNALADVAIGPEYADDSGKYLQSNNKRLQATRSSRMSYDERRAAKLWEESKRLVKLQPEEEPEPLR
ncbi:SDR family NAD(P)-dependent oxidoreductase [Pelagibacterium sp. 26DY04]|uniref:SDR family NAD(P)-dependent oxidoreductase n=1 Tax=Pelagibacterium sp. 26DY04 TaxID=2967130 RepID=UPI00281589B3|nr:SDR family NAD(P)-dependent oxidoreductase [Pelagibacterium sp. 26DY04]WMT88731.1 SDR family NAD(P)-dependent oxidoreductase [Pelagibacterium sp. 26DY04]